MSNKNSQKQTIAKAVKDNKASQTPQQPDALVTGSVSPAPYVSPGVEETEAAAPKGKKKTGKGAIQFGNQDKDKKFDLSRLNVPEGHVVVRHYGTVTLANGQKMEDPSSTRLQVYSQDTYDSLSAQGVKDGKQVPSQFETLGLNSEVLHKP